MNPYDILFGSNYEDDVLKHKKSEAAPTFDLTQELCAKEISLVHSDRSKRESTAGRMQASVDITEQASAVRQKQASVDRTGQAFATKLTLDKQLISAVKTTFIAFDTETTGLSDAYDRIIEAGAILYQEGKPVAEFNTLINPEKPIPAQASRVNHITNAMVKNAPKEPEAMEQLAAFLGDALQGDTVIVAHNACFDMKFLIRALSRCGMDAELRYADTLQIARKLVKGVENYKLGTLAEYFELVNEDAHRACADAKVCGDLLLRLVEHCGL